MDNVDFNNLPKEYPCRASYLGKDNTNIVNDNNKHTDRKVRQKY